MRFTHLVAVIHWPNNPSELIPQFASTIPLMVLSWLCLFECKFPPSPSSWNLTPCPLHAHRWHSTPLKPIVLSTTPLTTLSNVILFHHRWVVANNIPTITQLFTINDNLRMTNNSIAYINLNKESICETWCMSLYRRDWWGGGKRLTHLCSKVGGVWGAPTCWAFVTCPLLQKTLDTVDMSQWNCHSGIGYGHLYQKK